MKYAGPWVHHDEGNIRLDKDVRHNEAEGPHKEKIRVCHNEAEGSH